MVTTGYPRYKGDSFGCFVADIASGLSAEDQVSVLAPYAPGYPKVEVLDGVKVYRLPYFPFAASVAYGQGIPTNLKTFSCKLQLPFFALAMSLYTFILARKVDVIHGQWSVSACFALPASWFWKKPCLCSFHGSDLHGSKLILMLSRWVSRFVDLSLCVSEEQAQYLSIEPKVLSCGTDTQRFLPLNLERRSELRKQWSLPEDALLWLYVGSLIPLKRVELMLETLRFTREPWCLCIVGTGQEEASLREMVQRYDFEERVFFCGAKPYHEVHEAFQIADVHGLLSEREGKPTVVYQAMASQLPSVCTRAGGTVEQIVDGETGFLLEPQPREIARRLDELSNEQLRLEMGKKAQRRLLDMNIDLESIVQQQRELYRSLL